MKVSLAELLDRFSIEARKDFYGHGNPELIAEVKHEIMVASAPLRALSDEDLTTVLCGIATVSLRNADIAGCEWQIRQGHILPIEELGRRAVITRKLNDARSEAKQEISKALGENVETRHYGFGEHMPPEKTTLAIQEPATCETPGCGLKPGHARMHEILAGDDFGKLPGSREADDLNRCAVCGWPLTNNIAEGCTRGNCSMRPRPDRLFSPKRAEQESIDLKADRYLRATKD